MSTETQLISSLITKNSTILDLGCGSGELLADLYAKKNVQGYGIENNADMIEQCVNCGVNVIEQDLDQGLANFEQNSFDTVILKHTLQALLHPDLVLKEMLRVGRQGIVTFPNFSYYTNRMYLMFRGEMPMSRIIPYTWYETPNLHHCTFRDFESMCTKLNIRIVDCLVLDSNSELLSAGWYRLRNLVGAYAIYHITLQGK